MILKKPIFWIVVIILAAIVWFMANSNRQAERLAKAQKATATQMASKTTTPNSIEGPSTSSPASATPANEQQALSPTPINMANKAAPATEDGTQPPVLAKQ